MASPALSPEMDHTELGPQSINLIMSRYVDLLCSSILANFINIYWYLNLNLIIMTEYAASHSVLFCSDINIFFLVSQK